MHLYHEQKCDATCLSVRLTGRQKFPILVARASIVGLFGLIGVGYSDAQPPAAANPDAAQAVISFPSSPAGRAVDDRQPLHRRIDGLARDVNAHVIVNRRYIHQHPELSNREFETSKYIATKLHELGLEVRGPFAKTGVVGVLRGGKRGPTVALRAELDALPYTEEVDLPFKSIVRATGRDGDMVGVMHACGHDSHMAMLLGVAEIFVRIKDQLPGNVEFIFQTGEEGPPPGEEDGAVQMIREGVLSGDPKPEVIFGVHVVTQFETGQVGYRAGGELAGGDQVNITVHGRQANADTPWAGVDAIVVASQIVLGLQTIVSRQIDLTKAPAVISVMEIHGGAYDTVAETVKMTSMVQTFDPQTRLDVIAHIKRTAENIATSAGATTEIVVVPEMYAPAVYNDPKLVARMLPTLKRVAGVGLLEIPPQPFDDDFAFFQEKLPGLHVLIGARKPGEEFIPNHSPRFKLDESSFEIGVRTLANLSVDYMLGARP